MFLYLTELCRNCGDKDYCLNKQKLMLSYKHKVKVKQKGSLMKTIIDTDLRFELLKAMNLIVSSMNNEDAYDASGWLYIWPDGADDEEIREMAEGDYFEDVYNCFLKVCKYYGKDGLYTTTFE